MRLKVKFEFPSIVREGEEVGAVHEVKISLPNVEAGEPNTPIAKLELGLQQDVAEAGYLVIEGPAYHKQNARTREEFAHAFFGLRKRLLQSKWSWEQAQIIRDLLEIQEACPTPA